MKKPKPKHPNKKALYWNEVENYIEEKYKIKLRGYKREEDTVYRDFWHWVCDCTSIHNGCFFHLNTKEKDHLEWWIQEILEILNKEFGNCPFFWVSW